MLEPDDYQLLLVPGMSGYLWTIYAGRSYYDALLQAGAEIYEYRRGAMHAKTLTVDAIQQALRR